MQVAVRISRREPALGLLIGINVTPTPAKENNQVIFFSFNASFLKSNNKSTSVFCSVEEAVASFIGFEFLSVLV